MLVNPANNKKLEKGLRKVRRSDIVEQVLSSSSTKTSEGIDFRKLSNDNIDLNDSRAKYRNADGVS